MIDNEEKQRRSVRVADRNREQELDDIREMVSSESGRRHYWRTMVECKPFANCFTGNSTTFFNAGKQFIGQILFNDLMEAAPEAYPLMRKEALEAEKEDILYINGEHEEI